MKQSSSEKKYSGNATGKTAKPVNTAQQSSGKFLPADKVAGEKK